MSLIDRAAALSELIRQDSTLPPSPELTEALVDCCSELIDAGEPSLALDLLDRFDSRAGSEQEQEGRILTLRARALRVSGKYQEGLRLAQTMLSDPNDLMPPTALVPLRIVEAACLWQMNRVDEAVDRLLRLRGELVGRPDSILTARCVLELSSAEIFRGRLEEARAHTIEAIVSARRSGDCFAESVALANLGRIEKFLCRWPSAIEALQQSIELSDRNGHRIQSLITKRVLATVFWKQGSLDKSYELATIVHRGAAELGNEIQTWVAALALGLIEVHKGRFVAARLYFREGVDVDIANPESRRALLTSEFIGDTYLEEGNAQTALDRYNAVWPLAIALVPKGDIVAELKRRRAEAFYVLGRYPEALAEGQAALEHCRELGDRYEEAAVYRTLAQTSSKLGKPVEAKRWFDQGFAYYEDIETPYEWGKLWMAYGDWLASGESAEYGDKSAAAEAYRAAQDLLGGMGALGLLVKVEERLRQDGLKPFAAPTAPASNDAPAPKRPTRRARGAMELDRRSAWAKETFAFVTRNKLVLDLLEDVAKLARSDSPMLILGESGTGKELVAGGIHKLSERPGSFVPINCGALPREVIESELFGHVAGAFTGATRDKVGLFESCHRGTVFLDEIAEMTPDLQSRLLRFLESGELRRVGANRNAAVDTLIIAATNRGRPELERGEGFRIDLYYRLAHAVVMLPPLRRRGEDIDLLIDHLLSEACERDRKQVTLSKGARNRLLAFSWPGNVRQLRSTLQRLVILSGNGQEIRPDQVVLDEVQVPINLTEELELAERGRIVEALAAASGVRTDAAKMLGMSRTTLISKMQRYGIR